MPPRPASPPRSTAVARAGSGAPRSIGWSVAILILGTLLAYANAWRTPFLFDDRPSILENPTIRELGLAMFTPPNDSGLTVSGRPVLNISFALNRALGGESVVGYHAVNIAVHLLAGLVLFGLVRRTLARPGVAPRLASAAVPIATATAALWLWHPLQTESVTYIVQRAESLMALFYLFTLYAALRAAEYHEQNAPTLHRRWTVLAVLACALGMGTKEVMVSAPLLALFYDRTFLAGSFRAAWQARRGLYLALAATWVLLIGLVISTGNRGGTAGVGSGIGMWDYTLTQARAIIHYLRLSLWPEPLIFDYGTAVITWTEALPYAVGLLTLIALTLWATVRRPALGFVGVLFLASLAPTSSFVPVSTQTMAEHRMYLPLAAVAVFVAVGALHFFGRRALGGLALAALLLAGLTFARNRDYRTELGLWRDTVRKLPTSTRAHASVGAALFREERFAEAVAAFELALSLDPRDAGAHANLGNTLLRLNRPEEARRRFAEAIRLQPDYGEAHNNLGTLLLNAGRTDEAIASYRTAMGLAPDQSDVHYNLANALLAANRPAEAVAHYETAVRLRPDSAPARFNFGNALAHLGQLPAAKVQYEEALRVAPGMIDARFNLGNVCLELGDGESAIRHYESVLRVEPDYPDARANLDQARQVAAQRGARGR